jgi:hypothetical protein
VTRAWRGTRTLAPKRAKGLVREIVATQREAVEEYEDALGEPLPRGVRRLVASQAQEARAMLRRYVVRS